jgi:hypothetical protein
MRQAAQSCFGLKQRWLRPFRVSISQHSSSATYTSHFDTFRSADADSGLSGRDIYSSSATFKVLKLSSFFLHDQKEPKNLGFVKFLSRILDIFTSVKNIP